MITWCSGSRERSQDTFVASPRYPWARYGTLKCSHRALDERGTHLGVHIWSCDRLQHPPCDPETDKERKMSRKRTEVSYFCVLSDLRQLSSYIYTVDIPITIILIDTLFYLVHSRFWIYVSCLSSSQGWQMVLPVACKLSCPPFMSYSSEGS